MSNVVKDIKAYGVKWCKFTRKMLLTFHWDAPHCIFCPAAPPAVEYCAAVGPMFEQPHRPSADAVKV